MKKIYLILTCALLAFASTGFASENASTNVVTSVNVNGEAAAVWQATSNIDYSNKIFGVTGTTGGWSTPYQIESTYDYLYPPKLSFNANGDAVVVWMRSDSNYSYINTLYGVNYSSSTSSWSSPLLLSDPTENVYQNYTVNLSANGDFFVNWNSVTSDGSFVIRNVSAPLSAWGTTSPTTISN